MIKYIGAAAVLAAAYGIPGAMEATAITLALLSAMFYIVAFKLFAGLSQAMLLKEFDVLRMITIYMIYVTMMIVVFMGPYAYVALLAAPWFMLQTFINILSILIKYDIVGIEHK